MLCDFRDQMAKGDKASPWFFWDTWFWRSELPCQPSIYLELTMLEGSTKWPMERDHMTSLWGYMKQEMYGQPQLFQLQPLSDHNHMKVEPEPPSQALPELLIPKNYKM